MEEMSDSMTASRVLEIEFERYNESNDLYNKSYEISDSRNENLAVIEVSILALMFIMILIGNLFVMIALAVRKPKMNRMYYFLLHLCIADLITAFFNVLPQLAWDITYRFYGGNLLCKTIKYLQILGPYLSSYILVTTAIDRYQAICYPLSNCSWTPKRSQLMILISWLLALFFCCPQLYIFSYQRIPETDIYDCWGTFPRPYLTERIYVTWYAITVFIIPFIIILTTHICICREIFNNFHRKRESIEEIKSCIQYDFKNDKTLISSPKRNPSFKRLTVSKRSLTFSLRHSKRFNLNSQTKARNGSRNDSRNASRNDSKNSFSNPTLEANNLSSTPRSHSLRFVSRARIKTIKITVVIMVCYALCSSPFILCQLWVYWHPSPQSFFESSSVVAILMLLSSLNSSINPYICLFFNKNLIKSVKDFFFHPSVTHLDNNPINDTNAIYCFYDPRISINSSQTDDTSTSLRHCSYYLKNGNTLTLNSNHSRRSSIQLRTNLFRSSLLNNRILSSKRTMASMNDFKLDNNIDDL